jgi:signal transduction histidine kinase
MKLSPVRADAGTEPSPSAQLEGVCQLQIDQLLVVLPLIGACIAYYDPQSGQQQRLFRYAPGQTMLSASDLEYLASEVWLHDGMPVLTLSDLESGFLPGCGYACPLVHRSPNPEYLLLFASQELSAEQCQLVERSAGLLASHIALHQRCWRQHAEIELLEQVIQRTGHQLRNPLSLISLYAENLCLGLPGGQSQEQAAIIRETVNDLSANLTELIYCGQGVRLRATPHDLRQVVAEAVEGMRPLFERKGVQVTYPETSLVLPVDRLQMKQVFDNLLQNAVHFSPEGTAVRFRWRAFQSEALVEISDHGPGLSSQDLQNLFTPFYTQRPGGTGLGLAIARKIVLDHQGSLWAQNLPGGGAQFCLSLPRPQSR